MVSPAPSARGPLLVTRKIEVRGEPCATGFGDFVFVIDISAPSRWIVKVTVPLLLQLAGSLVTLLAMAALLLLDMPPAGTTVLSGAVAFMVMSSVAPDGRV